MRVTLPAFVLLTSLVACDGGGSSGAPADMASNATCANDPRGETYTAGMSQPGMDHLITVKLLSSTPAPPIKGNNTWLVEVLDAGGAPIDGATLSVLPWMPDHGHGTPIQVGITAMGGGQYQLDPVNLFMSGLWQVTITVTTSDGKTSDQSVFSFCIEG